MKKLYVANLQWEVTGDSLATLFGRFGDVSNASVIIDRETGRSRGFGFVEMLSEENAKRALEELNGTTFDGRTLTVREARPEGDRIPRDSALYGFQLEIINNETKEHLSKDMMSNNMQAVIRELEGIVEELKLLYPR